MHVYAVHREGGLRTAKHDFYSLEWHEVGFRYEIEGALVSWHHISVLAAILHS